MEALLTGETVTPAIEIGTSRAPALASALVPTVELARAQIYNNTDISDDAENGIIVADRETCSFQLFQIPDSAADNGCLDPDSLHPSRHDPTRHSAVLPFRLLDDNDGTRA